ncbi:MAG: BrxA/BrxB family bacilliredoxin [Gemmatimonadaceae bacterium]
MTLPVSAGMYPEQMLAPMRAELTGIGFSELRTPDEVDRELTAKGTALVVVNSICGCAARMARPAVRMALGESTARPQRLTTVFAGQDRAATDRARGYFTGYPPSSPSIALLRDGQIVFMLERWQIEGRSAPEIASDLKGALEEHCAPAAR